MTDRDALIARINRAAEAGLIGSVDRNIRITNVKHAQSDTELQLIARDLDQLEGTLRPAAAWAGPPSTSPVPAPAPAGAPTPAPTAPSPGSGKAVAGIIGCVVMIVVLVTVAVIGVAAFVTIRGATSSDGATSGSSEVASSYGLDEQGIAEFVDVYRERFGTSEVVELVMYDDYAVVQVPVEGKARVTGWIYRNGKWEEFGGVRASFPGARTVDLGRIDVAALVGNIERARTTLKVEEISSTYVVVHDYSDDEPPEVDIHVSNEYGESGYLATRPGGAVVRAFPYGS